MAKFISDKLNMKTMFDKKELNQEQLDKVSGGVTIGNYRIIQCLACGHQFDPDTTSRGEDVLIPNESGNGYSSYATWFCPACQKYERYKVIQIKQEDMMCGSIFSI